MQKTIAERARRAINYPLDSDESKYRPILVGGLLVILSIFVVPILAVFGYQLSVYESSLKGEQRPELNGIFSLISEGFMGAIILIPAFILEFVFVNIPTAVQLTGAIPAPTFVYSAATFILSFVAALVSPIFLALYAKNRNFKDTYQLDKITEIATNPEYIVQILVFLVLASIFQIVLIIPSLLIVTIPFITMFATIATTAYLGDLFSEFP